MTLGIYSAWAKVRSYRYLYGNLQFDGTSFEYVANPIGILIGRVIAVVLFLTYLLTVQYVPSMSLWVLAALIPLVPWVVLKSLQFRARNSVFRNIRFGFRGSYGQALWYVGLLPALVLAPFVAWGAVSAEANAELTRVDGSVALWLVAASVVRHSVWNLIGDLPERPFQECRWPSRSR